MVSIFVCCYKIVLFIRQFTSIQTSIKSIILIVLVVFAFRRKIVLVVFLLLFLFFEDNLHQFGNQLNQFLFFLNCLSCLRRQAYNCLSCLFTIVVLRVCVCEPYILRVHYGFMTGSYYMITMWLLWDNYVIYLLCLSHGNTVITPLPLRTFTEPCLEQFQCFPLRCFTPFRASFNVSKFQGLKQQHSCVK